MSYKSNKGKSAYCDHCDQECRYYVAILSGKYPKTHWFLCMPCYEEDNWQTKIKTKGLTMKNGSLNGSTKSSASKPKDNHSLEVWEENILETLNSTSETKNLWEKLNTEINQTFPTRSRSSKEET